ncbi:hypothetical protein BP6252_11641 [Coleophoma cylindrospora]|uniref:Glycoside hydrolase family 88 protein n=1 Tax=Coleophoma cylindrospora TaxID=1849047 RepID=A0A3D8QKF8_9HELO|nr:hypothetical protein BP6252_11641 [Coleophoma cylindrospora]
MTIRGDVIGQTLEDNTQSQSSKTMGKIVVAAVPEGVQDGNSSSPTTTIPNTLKQAAMVPREALAELFSENVIAKLWRVAIRERKKFGEAEPTAYPEYVTMTGPLANKYTLREADFWTCGFFPGSLYALLERSVKFPQYFPIPAQHRSSFSKDLLAVCRSWTGPIRGMATRTDTHDMSFIIQPALRMDWELTGNEESFQCVLTAALSLATRYCERVGAIRSWDSAVNARYSFVDMESDFLVIIDSMCNLDLLYYAGHQTGNQNLIEIATTHAKTVLRAIVRDDWSTYHLINFDAKTGEVKNQLTNQGWRDDSTWSRGQAWAVMGFAQTYYWTRDPIFLDAALRLSKYFIARLEQCRTIGRHTHPYVPLWDFDAPPTPTSTSGPLRDTSAGMIAVNGFLILHQLLVGEGRVDEAQELLHAAFEIMNQTLSLSLAPEHATFAVPTGGDAYPIVPEAEDGMGFDAILRHATANNNEDAHKRYADHGLVYADYYFLEAGNKLLRMGLW